jgi:phage terminase large subunit-like protein
VASEARWIDAGAWVACKDDDFPTLENAECFGAVDLGWRDDLAAFAKVFPDREKIEVDDNEEQPDHGPLYKINNAWVKVKFWMPADGKRDITKAPWTNWIQQGLITVTDGNTTDIDEIYHEVVNASKVYNLRRVCLDPNNARQFGQELMKAGIPVKEFWQNRKNYTEPMLDFETAISEGRLHHDGNDLLRWQIGNVQVEVDSQGYCMPSKGKSKDKIDGPVSLLMAWAESS